MNRINQSVIAGKDIITNPKGDLTKLLKEKGYKINIFDSKKFKESVSFKPLPISNFGTNSGFIQCSKIRFFTLEEFDENLVQGYIKLMKTGTGLEIRVVDTYNNESKEEEENYIKSGYIKVGYPSKFDPKKTKDG